MSFKITSQNFNINVENVEPALNALKNIYPSVIQVLDYDEPSTNLQYLMWILGYHVRIKVDQSIFTISQPWDYSPKIENEDSILTLTTLSEYMTIDSYVVVEVDGKEIRFEKNTKSIKTKDAPTESTSPTRNKSFLTAEPSEKLEENNISTSIDISEETVESKPIKRRSKKSKEI